MKKTLRTRIVQWWYQSGKAAIIYSEDGKYYYITGESWPSRKWMSVQTTPGEVPDEKKNSTMDGWLELHCDDGRVYHRHVLPFAMYELKSGKRGKISRSDDKYLDYASNASQW